MGAFGQASNPRSQVWLSNHSATEPHILAGTVIFSDVNFLQDVVYHIIIKIVVFFTELF